MVVIGRVHLVSPLLRATSAKTPEWLPANTAPENTTGRPAMSRISEMALVRLVRERVTLHSSLPLALCSATNSPDAKGAMIASPAGTALEALRIRAGSVRAW